MLCCRPFPVGFPVSSFSREARITSAKAPPPFGSCKQNFSCQKCWGEPSSSTIGLPLPLRCRIPAYSLGERLPYPGGTYQLSASVLIPLRTHHIQARPQVLRLLRPRIRNALSLTHRIWPKSRAPIQPIVDCQGRYKKVSLGEDESSRTPLKRAPSNDEYPTHTHARALTEGKRWARRISVTRYTINISRLIL